MHNEDLDAEQPRHGGHSRRRWRDVGGALFVTTPMGAFGANHALRQTFVLRDMPAMQQPEACISNVKDLLDETDGPKDKVNLVGRLMAVFADWFGARGERPA